MDDGMNEITPTAEIDNAIASISGGAMDKEEIIFLYDRLMSLKQAAAETLDRMKGAMIAWIELNGSIEIGDVRYYAAVEKKTKPRNPNMAEFYKAVLMAVGGDEEAFASSLASNAFKHGQLRKLLAEIHGDEQGEIQYGLLFETIEESKLAEGKPIKKLQVMDKKFLR